MTPGKTALSVPQAGPMAGAEGQQEAPELTDIPLFDSSVDLPVIPPGSDPPPPFGVYHAEQIHDRGALPLQQVDWTQVVALRKIASSAITDQTQGYIAQTGRSMPAEDRLLMGRAIIRRVVADHVRALHRDGAALWSTDTEFSYIHTEARQTHT